MIVDGMRYTDNFDWECYLARYADIADDYHDYAGAFKHWNEHGQFEGRIPGCLIGPVLEDGDGDADQPPATGSDNKGLLIAGAGLLIVFHKQIAKLFGIKI